MQFWFNKILK